LKAFLKTQVGRDPTDMDTGLARVQEEHSAGEPYGDDRTILILRRMPVM